MEETDGLSQAQVRHNFVNLKKLTGLNEGFGTVRWKTCVLRNCYYSFIQSYLGCCTQTLRHFIHSSNNNPHLSDEFCCRNI
jgi:hypothetical protein